MSAKNKQYFIKIYGCLFNHADAARIRTVLNKTGYTETNSEEQADIIIVVTCSVRQRAEDKAIYYANKHSQHKDVLVTGCMVRRDYLDTSDVRSKKQLKKLQQRLPAVKAFFDITDLHELPTLLKKIKTAQKPIISLKRDLAAEYYDKIVPTQTASAGLISSIPIMTGCSEFCTYCIVPYTRGQEKFRDMKSIINEVKQSINSGAKIIYLVGQIVNKWHKNDNTFLDLLKAVTEIEGDFLLGFTSPHPNYITRELLEFIRDHPKMLKNLGLPLQSGSNRVLAAMNRKYTREKFLEIAYLARKTIPNLYLTTDIIVGFPPETEKDFLQTLDIVKKIRFDKIFAAKYSPRHNTHKKRMHDLAYQKEVTSRYNRLNRLAERIFAQNNQKLIGQSFKTLVTQEKQGLTQRNQLVDINNWQPDYKALLGKWVEIKVIDGGRRGIVGEIVKFL